LSGHNVSCVGNGKPGWAEMLYNCGYFRNSGLTSPVLVTYIKSIWYWHMYLQVRSEHNINLLKNTGYMTHQQV